MRGHHRLNLTTHTRQLWYTTLPHIPGHHFRLRLSFFTSATARKPSATQPPVSMPELIQLTFLGTAAGRPSPSRNVSSLAIKVDNQIWVVDAGEGTQHQFMRSKLKMNQVKKIFITHMHADHIMGLPGLLCTISAGEGSVLPGQVDPRLQSSSSHPPTEIYGPSGLRLFMRTTLALTQSVLSRPYVVNELLFPGDPVESGPRHPSELAGQDIQAHDDSFWRDFVQESKQKDGIEVSAGPILHTVPCIGFVFTEQPRPEPIDPNRYIPHLQRSVNAQALAQQGVRNPLSIMSKISRDRQTVTLADGTVLTPPKLGGPGRRVVVLGDTYDATAISPLALDADLVVHEATNAYLPNLDENQAPARINQVTGKEVSRDSVRKVAREHGHSTPEVAGDFAKLVRARQLVLNHLSVKYRDPGRDLVDDQAGETDSTRLAKAMLQEIARLAAEAGGLEPGQVQVASDFMQIDIPRRENRPAE